MIMKPFLISAIFAFSSIVHSADVRLSKGMDTMARKVYAELVDLPDNMVISPLSIFTAMGLLQRGAPKGSRTRLQLVSLLRSSALAILSVSLRYRLLSPY